MEPVKLGNKYLTLPIIQGGMGVGVSLSQLAGAVASFGAMGVISGVNPGYRRENFMSHPLKDNELALEEEVRKAKEISKGRGLIGVNVMVAITQYREMVEAAVKGGADAIISGAGLPLQLPEFVPKDILIAPIVSSKRALRIIIKTWKKKFSRLPDFVVVEGPKAGGHLGFKTKEISTITLDEIVKDVGAYLDDIKEKENIHIPFFAAGGIRNGKRRKELMDLGASGIQVSTPFIATEECDVSKEFKETIINSTDKDLKIIQSPAGFPARGVYNSFLQEVDYNLVPKRHCINCLKTCDPNHTPYCISKMLCESAKGRKGLIFSGTDIDDINEITTVEKVLQKLMEEI
ncbi:MAG: nitronate monooxygenase family protein [Tissierellia bacterium]|nr:nitronate monooxygenase family protein [Tissierellia bacterium]